MGSNSSKALLRIFVSSTDHVKHELLSVIHSYKFWEVSDKVPVVIEIVDEEEKIRKFYEIIRPQLESMRYGCLVTIEKIEVLLSKSGKSRK